MHAFVDKKKKRKKERERENNFRIKETNNFRFFYAVNVLPIAKYILQITLLIINHRCDR